MLNLMSHQRSPTQVRNHPPGGCGERDTGCGTDSGAGPPAATWLEDTVQRPAPSLGASRDAAVPSCYRCSQGTQDTDAVPQLISATSRELPKLHDQQGWGPSLGGPRSGESGSRGSGAVTAEQRRQDVGAGDQDSPEHPTYSRERRVLCGAGCGARGSLEGVR